MRDARIPDFSKKHDREKGTAEGGRGCRENQGKEMVMEGQTGKKCLRKSQETGGGQSCAGD